jgi:hypothetical protein
VSPVLRAVTPAIASPIVATFHGFVMAVILLVMRRPPGGGYSRRPW